MKTPFDPRHKKRIQKFRRLFAYSFQPEQYQENKRIKVIIDNLPTIDNYIEAVAPEWPVPRLNKVDLAILRLGVYELLVEQKTPPKVIIDEGVEMGKAFGSESTAKFVNGVLGKLLERRTAAGEGEQIGVVKKTEPLVVTSV